jgi:hypothetical protein
MHFLDDGKNNLSYDQNKFNLKTILARAEAERTSKEGDSVTVGL